ncbi:hypothetical protein, partial [Caulobacter sp. 17J65-9]|uniref:hypothetical protein n=1 Tax=Caulobacter sp. 17J65-9 TaxID=2709382 RepID=UPI0013CD9CF6
MSAPPLTFWRKPLAAAALATLADQLLYGQGFGSILGVFALAWTVTLALARPAVHRDRRALAALAVAALFAVALIDRPGLVAWSLFWIALGAAALLPRTGRFDDVWRWAQRLVVQAVGGVWAPLGDRRR